MKIGINLKELSLTVPFYGEEKPSNRTITKKWLVIVTFLLGLISVLAWWFYYNQGLTLSYNDARSHLNIARRVVDNLQPGFAQIGSVWLPLFHILELPLIWNDFMWHSGIAGSIISMVSYVVGGVVMVLLAKRLKFDIGAILVSLGVYALNPNLLFLQTAPMTEALLITVSTSAVYFLVRWIQTYDLRALMASAFFTLLATLSRYDGWFLFLFMSIVVFVFSYKHKKYKFAEGNLILYCSLAGFGVFLWFLWNLVIFKDPFYFATGPYSAKAQQDVLLAEGRLFSKGNPVYSTFLYLLTINYNIGSLLSVLAVVGGLVFIKTKEISKKVKWTASLLLVPMVFNIFSLIAGQSVIHLPGIAPYTWFNDRYGLMVLPAVAIAIGFLVNKRKVAVILVTITLLLQTYIFYSTNQIITIQDGVRGASGDFLDDVGRWVGSNVDDKLILVAASSNDALLFKSGKPLKQFITEGAQEYWQSSLKDPTKYASWVIMHKGDLVYKNLKDNPNFIDHYRLMYKGDFANIYKLDKNAKQSLTKEELP